MKEKIEAILVKYDPVKLIKMGAPQDEYDSEAQMIHERTTRHFSQEKIHEIVYKVFQDQFGKGMNYKLDDYDNMVLVGEESVPDDVTTRIIGKFDSYKEIAQEIKDLLDQKKIAAT